MHYKCPYAHAQTHKCPSLQYANREGKSCPLYALVTLISQPLSQRRLHDFCTCRKLCKLCAADDTRYSLGKPRYWACPASSVRCGAYLFSLWIPYSLEPPLFYTSSNGVAVMQHVYSSLSNNCCRAASRGSTSFLQAQAPSFKSAPHVIHSPAQSALQTNLDSMASTNAVVNTSSRSTAPFSRRKMSGFSSSISFSARWAVTG